MPCSRPGYSFRTQCVRGSSGVSTLAIQDRTNHLSVSPRFPHPLHQEDLQNQITCTHDAIRKLSGRGEMPGARQQAAQKRKYGVQIRGEGNRSAVKKRIPDDAAAHGGGEPEDKNAKEVQVLPDRLECPGHRESEGPGPVRPSGSSVVSGRFASGIGPGIPVGRELLRVDAAWRENGPDSP